MKAILEDNGWLRFKCPACGHDHAVNVTHSDQSPFWKFNGNLESPTLEPSLLFRTGKFADINWFNALPESEKEFHNKHSIQCHSYIRNGRIEYAVDCSHHLAGQAIELPEI